MSEEKEKKDVIESEEISSQLGLFDSFLQKFISRKLLVFFIATVLMFLGKIDPPQWVIVCSIYIGSQAILDAVVGWKNGGR